jgi:hypothetical protein
MSRHRSDFLFRKLYLLLSPWNLVGVLFFFVSYHLRFVFSARSFAIYKDRGIVLLHLNSGQFVEHCIHQFYGKSSPLQLLTTQGAAGCTRS